MILFEQTPYHEKRKLGKTEFPCDPEKSRTTDGNKFRIVQSMLEKTSVSDPKIRHAQQ